MSCKPTSAPWTVSRARAGFAIVDRFGTTIGAAHKRPSGYRTASEQEANARLIAAAPDLLAVVKELEASAEYWSEYDVPIGIVDRIKEAIAKAEGRS